MAKSVLYMSVGRKTFDYAGHRDGDHQGAPIHLISVVLGAGRRLCVEGGVRLELTRVLNAPGATHLRHRVMP